MSNQAYPSTRKDLAVNLVDEIKFANEICIDAKPECKLPPLEILDVSTLSSSLGTHKNDQSIPTSQRAMVSSTSVTPNHLQVFTTLEDMSHPNKVQLMSTKSHDPVLFPNDKLIPHLHRLASKDACTQMKEENHMLHGTTQIVLDDKNSLVISISRLVSSNSES